MLDQDTLRNKLLATNCFTQNKYLTKYIKLCQTKNTVDDKFLYKHHILPRKYFNYFKLPLDSSTDNLVLLTYYQHILAHYYLALCSRPEWLVNANITAFCLLTNSTFLSKDELKKIKSLKQFKALYNNYSKTAKSPEHCKALAAARDSHSSTKGKKAIYNPKTNVQCFIFIEDLPKYLALGFKLGGKPMTEEAKLSIGKSNKIRLSGKKSAKKGKVGKAISGGLIGNKVKCIELNIIFENISEAKNWLYNNTGVSGGQIKNCCAGAREKTGGYHWCYVYKGGD